MTRPDKILCVFILAAALGTWFQVSAQRPAASGLSGPGGAAGVAGATGPTGPTGATGPSSHGLSFAIGSPGSGVALTNTSQSATLTVPFGCTIGNPAGSKYSITLGAGDSGTVTITFWKIASGTAIPTVANLINTSGLSLASGTAVQSATFSDFTTATVTANDMMIMNITAITGTIDSVLVVLPCGS